MDSLSIMLFHIRENSMSPTADYNEPLRDDDVCVSSLYATKKDWRAHEKIMRRRGFKDEAQQARAVIKILKKMRARTLQELGDRTDTFIHIGDAAKRVVARIVPSEPSDPKKETDDDD